MRIRASVTLALIAASIGPSSVRADGACVQCHAIRAEARLRDPAIEASGDAHGGHGVGCADCHGGDPSDRSARAHDFGQGFVGRPDGIGTAQLCGGCHDGSTEAPAVAEGYRASPHGVAVSAGRPAATCTSCHGAHGVEPIGPSTALARCVSCHADEERMRAAGLPADVFAEWSTSVHGSAFAVGDGDAPTCIGCHDPHRNAAGLAAVSACGGCHPEAREAFDRGPHADAFERLGFLDCAECHGSHAIERPGRPMLTGLDAVCGRCHGRGRPTFERVRALAALTEGAARVRAQTQDDDPRRRALVTAVHALDPDGLARAVASVAPGDAAAPDRGPVGAEGQQTETERPGPGRPRLWLRLAQALGLVLLALVAMRLWARWRYRR